MNKQYIMEQVGIINDYINRIANEINRQDTHDYYIHQLAFGGVNRFKAILNECKSEVTNVDNEDQRINGTDENKQEEIACDDTGAGSTTSSTTENNQPVDEVQPNDGEPTEDSGECNSNEG